MRLPRPTRRRSGPRRADVRPQRAIASGLGVLGLIAIFAWVAVRAAGGLLFVDYYTLNLSAPDVGNLATHSDVRIAGDRVGQVVETRVEGGRVLVQMQLSPGIDPLPVDTEAVVRGKGLIGARFVELRPGGAEESLEDGATIRGGEGSLTVGVPEALETFDPRTRRAFGSMIDGFGSGLLSRGADLNDTLRSLPELERNLQDVSEAVIERPGAARRFFPSVEEAASAFDGAREDIARGFAPEARALRPFVERREELRATLEEASPTLGVMRPALSEGRALLAAAGELADSVRDTLPAAPPGLRSTTEMLRTAPEPLRRTAALIRTAGPAIPATLRLLRGARPVLDPLARAFDDLRPLFATLGERGCDLDNVADNYRSMIGFGTRGLSGGEIGPPTDARITIVGEGLAGKGRQPDPLIVRDPYPAPCSSLPEAGR